MTEVPRSRLGVLGLPGNCVWCGRRPVGAYEMSMHGEITCAGHGVAERCGLCTRPRSPGPGWSRLSGSGVRCPTCAADAVDTQERARRYIPRVREQLAALGIELDQRVRVRLVDVIHLPDGAAATGLTHGWEHSRTVAGIEVVRGLTSVHFGATVAHEIGHAWLIQRGAPVTDPVLLEGVCEVFASAWLKRRPGRLPQALREAMAANPDNVYGAGYRLVRDAVARAGIRIVLHELCRSGNLP